MKLKHLQDHGHARVLFRRQAPELFGAEGDALDVAEEMLEQIARHLGPDWYPWRVEIQRMQSIGRGKRASVIVTFQKRDSPRAYKPDSG